VIRAILGALLACALVACTPPPAWLPGDPPLQIWADTDATWAAIAGGCEAWSMTGLTCERALDPDDAAITARTAELGGDDNGEAGFRPQTGDHLVPEWSVYIRLDPGVVGTPDGPVIAAHEVGHVLGIWEHVPAETAPWALMRDRGTLLGSGAGVSDADLTALEQAWGVPRGEW